jgi:hypothetical protein
MWSEDEIRAAYDHGSTAGVCEDVDDIISALHYRFHGWSEPCCSSADDAPVLSRAAAVPAQEPAPTHPLIAAADEVRRIRNEGGVGPYARHFEDWLRERATEPGGER